METPADSRPLYLIIESSNHHIITLDQAGSFHEVVIKDALRHIIQ